MHFIKLGRKNKPALIILHGWGLSSDKYKKLGSLLSGDFQVFIPDLPGFGNSEDPGKPYGNDDYAKEIIAFAKEQDIKEAYFIGHSFGGRIAMKLANKDPKLVKGLVLTGVPGVEKFYWKRSLKRFIYWSSAKSLKAFTFIPAVKKIRRKFYSNRDIGKLDGVMMETFNKIIKENLDNAAKKIQQPTLLLWGNRDQMALVIDAEKILTIIPHSYLKIFTKVGHRLPYEKPYEFAREVINFFT